MADLCKEAIEEFKQHPVWKYKYLSAFEFSIGSGRESIDRLFGPELVTPLRKFIEEDEAVPNTDGTFAKPCQVFKLDEEADAIDA